MFSGTAAAYRGTERYPASLYFWELANMGGRKLSFSLVPGLCVARCKQHVLALRAAKAMAWLSGARDSCPSLYCCGLAEC